MKLFLSSPLYQSLFPRVTRLAWMVAATRRLLELLPSCAGAYWSTRWRAAGAALAVVGGFWVPGWISMARTQEVVQATAQPSRVLVNAAAPTISGFSPTSGPVGTSVTITGTNFGSLEAVMFAGNVYAAGSFTATQIVATVPSGAQTGPITVTTSGGSVTTTTNFTVGGASEAPTITSATTASATVGYAFSYQITASPVATSYGAGGLPGGLSVNTSTGLISGTPTTPGNVSISLSATNGTGTGTATLGLTVVSNYTTFSNWQSANFTSAELQNAAISGPLATPAGDGISNLLKYALGLPAKRIGTASLPTQSFTTVGTARYLTLTYIHNKAATDLTLNVQASSDLTNWNAGTTYTTEISRTPNADGSETVVTRDNTAVSASAVKRFLRLQVSK